MEQLPLYADERTLTFCAFCAGKTGTRDHCPSRILLDEPFPENLPVVPACLACNTLFSPDEEYLACLLSCVIAGSSEPEAMPREKTRRILAAKPALRARIEQSHTVKDGSIIFTPEHGRVTTVITKLAKGHALYELHELCIEEPAEVWYLPLHQMTEKQRQSFETPEPSSIWPEVGSRAMQRLITNTDMTSNGWIDVQPELYRYCAQLGIGIDIRIVIHEYLACQVCWAF